MVDPPPGFSTWRTERGGSDKGGGGLAILYKETLPAHQWNPPVPEQLRYIMNERQWLLLDNQKELSCMCKSRVNQPAMMAS